jgi:rubredoxin
MAKAAAAPKKRGVKKATTTVAAQKKSAVVSKKKTAPLKKEPVKKVLAGKSSASKTGGKTLQKNVTKKAVPKKPSKDMTRYRCKVCGYIYSPFRGEPHNGIPAGTSFDDLPDTYLCPVCGQDGKGRIGKWGFEEWHPTRYICSLCNYIYDERRGEPHRGIKPGTRFEDLPDDYTCPVCATDPKIRLQFGKVFKPGFSPLEI